MKAQACDWAWMAEAGDDGRLSGDEHASFRRHVERCAICAEGVREVEQLRDRMEGIPAPALSDFQHHRQRQLLLARAGGMRATSLRPRFAWARLMAASAVAIAVVGIGAWRFGGHRGDVVATVPHYEVTDLRGASWTNEEAGTIARVKLTEGSAAFHVHKLNAGQRFFVSLPDGEIEVRGTRFVVDIVDGRTNYVVVMEGKVALRQGAGGERLLVAGDRWDAPVRASSTIASREIVAAPPPAVTAAEVHAAKASNVRAVAHASRHSERAADAATTRPAVEEPRAPDAGAATRSLDAPPNLFARGMSAFRAGRYAEAEGLWRQFAADHPQDPRIEDITFLRAVVRARQGDVEGAAALARAYLERFPRGMRRKEAEALTRHAGP